MDQIVRMKEILEMVDDIEENISGENGLNEGSISLEAIKTLSQVLFVVRTKVLEPALETLEEDDD